MGKVAFRRGGVYPKDKKNLSKNFVLETVTPGSKVFVPLIQHIGAPSAPVVEKGDFVSVGQLIAKATSYVSANVHSPVSGKVLDFEVRENIVGRKIRHIVIENDFQYAKSFMDILENPTREDIINRVSEAGIVGMGGATFPTHVKLDVKKKIDYLIVNGTECEPYITIDYRLMLEKTKEILKGAKYAQKATGAGKILIGIEANKDDAIGLFKELLADDDSIEVFRLKNKYPQGGEKQLIYSLTKRLVPNGGLPADIGCIVLNVSTCHAIYEAIDLGKPSYTRYLTVTGEGVLRSANLIASVGIPFSEIIEKTGYFKTTTKLISGGPMMGISLHNFKPVVSKGSSALLFLTKKEAQVASTTPCIGCAKCAQVCPMHLMPMKIDT
ncbi:MAG: RnfABCDGE type electron transport complex subunit C, partial [Clostridiales bacterium]|nr:RnfABCDGE type electron transport complex subunit C [Clostridiales bacterium]